MKIEQKRLDKYIKNLHVSNCPICGKSDWSMTDRVFEVSELTNKISRTGNNVIPIVPITCDNCGNTYFINALRAGLIDKEEQAENENDEHEDK